MSRWINKLWTKNDCGGLIPTRTTNHWPLRLSFFPCIFSVLIFCRSHVALGEYQRQGEEARLVIPIPQFASVIRLPGWHVGGLCLPTVTISGSDRCSDWLWAGRPRAIEEAVVRPHQEVRYGIPHDDGTPLGQEPRVNGCGMVALRRHHRTRFAPSHHGILVYATCRNRWKRN